MLLPDTAGSVLSVREVVHVVRWLSSLNSCFVKIKRVSYASKLYKNHTAEPLHARYNWTGCKRSCKSEPPTVISKHQSYHNSTVASTTGLLTVLNMSRPQQCSTHTVGPSQHHCFNPSHPVATQAPLVFLRMTRLFKAFQPTERHFGIVDILISKDSKLPRGWLTFLLIKCYPLL